MNVQVRHALANAVIHCHKCSFGAHPDFNCARKQLSVLKERTNERRWQVAKQFKMFLGHQQTVANKKRSVIKKGQRDFVFENHRGVELAKRNFAKQTDVVCAQETTFQQFFSLLLQEFRQTPVL